MVTTITLPTPFRRYVDNQETVRSRAATVATAIEDACQQFPQLAERMLGPQGGLMGHLTASMDGEIVPHAKLATTEIGDGDVIDILFVACGG